jgi:hypothetical protein
MATRAASVIAAIVLACAPVSVGAQERQTEHTVKLAPGQKPPPATIADMAWLAGHWTGPAFGGLSEEIWSAPRDGVMMGMFRLVRDGKPVFYELLTISEHQGSLLLRLKHFNPDLTGWEEKNHTIDFPLVARSPGMIQFAGMTFKPHEERLTVHLAIGEKDGRIREETFEYTRMPAAARTDTP